MSEPTEGGASSTPSAGPPGPSPTGHGGVGAPAGDGAPVPRPSLRGRATEARARAEDLKRSAAERFTAERERRSSVRIAADLYERDRRFAGALLAGGLAFRIFLWLLPFALLGVTALGFVSTRLRDSAESLAHDVGMSAALAGTVAQAVRSSASGRLGLFLLALVLVLWAGRSVVRALRVVHALAWQTGRPTRSSFLDSVVFLGWTAVVMAIPFLARPLYAGSFPTDVLAWVAVGAAVSAAALWGEIVLPRAEGVRWTWLVPGALVFGLGIEGLRIATSVYFADKLARSMSLYGSLGFTVVFLVWLYVIGRLIVAGASLNAALWESRRREQESSTAS